LKAGCEDGVVSGAPFCLLEISSLKGTHGSSSCAQPQALPYTVGSAVKCMAQDRGF